LIYIQRGFLLRSNLSFDVPNLSFWRPRCADYPYQNYKLNSSDHPNEARGYRLSMDGREANSIYTITPILGTGYVLEVFDELFYG